MMLSYLWTAYMYSSSLTSRGAAGEEERVLSSLYSEFSSGAGEESSQKSGEDQYQLI